MTEEERLEMAMLDFIKGGDESNTVLLDKVLHNDFRVTNNGFMGKPGVTVIDKQHYIKNIKAGVFGGHARKVSIDYIDVSGIIGMVKVRLESSKHSFVSYNSFVLDTDNEWRLINNLAVVVAKK